MRGKVADDTVLGRGVGGIQVGGEGFGGMLASFTLALSGLRLNDTVHRPLLLFGLCTNTLLLV